MCVDDVVDGLSIGERAEPESNENLSRNRLAAFLGRRELELSGGKHGQSCQVAVGSSAVREQLGVVYGSGSAQVKLDRDRNGLVLDLPSQFLGYIGRALPDESGRHEFRFLMDVPAGEESAS